MRHMCPSRISEAVGDLRAYPLALGVPRQLTAPGDAPGAPLRLREPRTAQDQREVPPASAGISATLTRSPAGTPVDRLLQYLCGQRRDRVQLDDRPPPEPVLVLLRGMRHQTRELQPVQPALHALAVALDEPSDRPLIAAVGDPAPAHDRRQTDHELRERAAIPRRTVTAGPLLPPPPPPQVRQHRDRRRLHARVPLMQPPDPAARLFDRGEDLNTQGLGGKRRRMAERAP
jgi:hypothetical protein